MTHQTLCPNTTTMNQPANSGALPDPHALDLLQHVLALMGAPVGLIDQRGRWLLISEPMRQALNRHSTPPVATQQLIQPVIAIGEVPPATMARSAHRTGHTAMSVLSAKAVDCIRRHQPDLHCLQKGDAGKMQATNLFRSTQTDACTIRLTPLISAGTTLCLLTLQTEIHGTGIDKATGELISQLREQALRDPLTGLYNRRWVMQEAIACLAETTGRQRPPACLMLLDLDHFKTINDHHGHLAGDQVLQIVGARLTALVRTGDRICRYGGEEFLVLLPRTPLDTAKLIAERMRQQISLPMDCLPGYRLTASAGLTAVDTADIAIDEAVQRADEALYAAKGAGRDCVRSKL